ncbi:MAG: M20 family metallopeptidase [Dehalococcoidia bacterium]
MPDADAMKSVVQRTIDAASAELRSLSLDIHAHPELNFQEEHAHRAITDYLEAQGFAVERGAYRILTAFEARAGSGAPAVAVLCEYDALPGIGHGCGHNLIAIAGVAAGLALKAALNDGDGAVVVLGTPAEEGGGGKIEMIDRGAFERIDAAMMLHPAPEDSAWPRINALQALEVEYFGKNAHAAVRPWDGVNALDALVLAYNGISLLRQQMPLDSRVHGVIVKGGDKPNIIPDHAAAEFYVRAKDEASLQRLQQRVLACFQGAAEATGCRLEARWVGRVYSNMANNVPMAEAYVENARALGKTLPPRADGFSGGSTDMGNVSHVVPSIHPMFAIATKAGNHTPEFAAASATPEAHAQALLAAKALAMTAVDLFTDPSLIEGAKDQFRAAHPA